MDSPYEMLATTHFLVSIWFEVFAFGASLNKHDGQIPPN